MWTNLILKFKAVSDFQIFSQLITFFSAQICLQRGSKMNELNFLAFVVDSSTFVVKNDGCWSINCGRQSTCRRS